MLTFLLVMIGCAPPADAPVTLRLGYMPNVTHAPGIVAVERGLIRDALGEGAQVEATTFNAGPSAVEALLSGGLDAAYIGPNPAINAYVKSKGEAVRVVAGCTSGGAFLIVDPAVTGAADLKGKAIGTPQLGNTQDVALRAWLAGQGLRTDLLGGGDVTIRPQDNAQSLEALRSHDIVGAWVPEPWATRLQTEGGGKVLVDERDLWPDRAYVTVHLLVRRDWWEAHPTAARALVAAHVDAVDWTVAHPAEAQGVVNAAIGRITGKALKPETLTAAWSNLTFTVDPIASSLRRSGEDAVHAGLLDLGGVDLAGLHDLLLLDEVLVARGRPAIGAAR